MLAPESAPLFFRELEKIASLAHAPREQVLALAGLMERLFFEATKQEQIAFSSLFARISYAGHLFHFQEDTLRTVHGFRLAAKRVRGGQLATEAVVQLGLTAVAAVVTVLTGSQTHSSSTSGENLGLHQGRIPHSALPLVEEASGPGWLRTARVVALRDDPQDHCLMARDEENPTRVIRVRYALPTRNEHFMPTIQLLRKVFGFPVVLNLLDVDVDASGDYCPRAFVVEPDYLMDVSAISECFKDTGPEPYAYLVKKFLPNETNAAMLLGNIANFFLDRLLNEPSVAWQPLFRETFQLYPFTYAPMSDAEVREISGKAQKHFLNLKSMASGGLAQQGIQPDDCVLEPTFFSAQYGIQGRLDLFYRTERASAIVELKSGKPYKPNSYGIQRSHFTQTLLYDLLVRSVFGHSTDPAKYILYSGVDVNHLRFAPTIAPEQWEALQLRNQLVALERLLTKIRPGDEVAPVLNRLRASNGQGFMERDFKQFEAAYTGLSRLEKKYFNAFTGFAAREHWLAKVGEENADVANGHASLWRSDFERKQADFSILSHLEILENRADQPEPCIIFQKTSRTHPLANFRVGDIAVLYPALEDTDTVLRHQIIKCTITEIGSERVAVQPRYRQFNLKPFETEGSWRLEPDMMDTGFAAMYRGLLDWAGASAEKRALVLGERAPDNPTPDPSPEGRGGVEYTVEYTVEDASREGVTYTLSKAVEGAPQTVIAGATEDVSEGIAPPLPSGEGSGVGLSRLIASRDYFLLWGPPGTGKTSVMLRDLAHWVLRDTTDNLLLLAYTNRAVDEICEALDNIQDDIRSQYVRIGGKHATAERFRDQLLSTKIAGAKNRAELRAVLESHRIFVSTVASFGQNEGLLRLKKFHRLVVDEASQILEPQLIGLLTRFEHFTLIGDHRQLPAVTAQRTASTVVEDADLQTIGLTDLRDSYFERLYRHCQAKGWHWAFGQLERQGRMHADIMDFPKKHFYDGNLHTLASTPDEQHRQHQALWYDLPGFDAVLEKTIAENRVVFMHVAPEDVLPNQKTSRPEAAAAARIVLFFKNLYAINGKAWRPTQTIGIITPWRAQIAQLRASLSEVGLDPDELTIDTVERYQGGARDIILISTCVHSEEQLASLVNLSSEGVDRKMNVALTRAREHVVMLGNEPVLRKDAHYDAFIEQYKIDLLRG